MKKRLMMIIVATALCVGCSNSDTLGTEVNNQQQEMAEETYVTKEIEVEEKAEEVIEEVIHMHNYIEEVTAEATCEADGLKTFICECGDSYTEVITATGHSYGEYVYNNDATTSADGTETATCVCGLTDTRTAEGSKLEYTYANLDKTMYAKQSVNVRDLPTADGNKLGGLSYAQEVKVLGQCNETEWYKIEFNGGVGYVSNSYLIDEKPVQQTTETNQSSGVSENTYILEGTNYKLEYGVMYLNVCGHNLTGERVLSRSQGHFPYPIGQLIDNGDGTYSVYTLGSHGYFLDGQFYIHDTSATTNTWDNLKQQGYTVSYAGGSTWTSCVGGYDEGCIHKLLVY